MPVREPTPQSLAEKALRGAGFSRIKVFRLYSPEDAGGEVEILFIARERGSGQALPYTAYLRDKPDADPLICDSW